MRKIGFTGTHVGMTDAQLELVRTVLDAHGLVAGGQFDEVHHGDCVGADDQFHQLATKAGFRTVVHPPEDPKLRAYCQADLVLPEKDYLARDRDIVNASDVLLATPRTMLEQRRGGTWYTIRYARARWTGSDRKVIVVLPDGTIQ